MKKSIISFIAGALIFGSIGVFAGGFVANVADFKVMLNGKEFVSEYPALEVDGRTYLPLRAMGEALGVAVNWNEDLKQVEVGGKPSSNKVGYYEDSPSIPDYGFVVGRKINGDPEVTKDMVKLFYGYASDASLIDADFKLYISVLEREGFVFYQKQDSAVYYINRNKETMVTMLKATFGGGSMGGCYIFYSKPQ